LNLYSESSKPRSFFTITAVVVVSVTFFLALTVGYLGYFAFGNSTKSLILYNLPSDDPISVTAQICYVLTIMGSYVLLVRPIFHIIESAKWYRFGQEEFNPNELSMQSHSDNSIYLHTHDAPFTWWMYIRHFTFRTLVVALACFFALLIPNVNLLLTLVGAILGTIISVMIPVLFYNRAYSYPESKYRKDDEEIE
jgi:amino acid permease